MVELQFQSSLPQTTEAVAPVGAEPMRRDREVVARTFLVGWGGTGLEKIAGKISFEYLLFLFREAVSTGATSLPSEEGAMPTLIWTQTTSNASCILITLRPTNFSLSPLFTRRCVPNNFE